MRRQEGSEGFQSTCRKLLPCKLGAIFVLVVTVALLTWWIVECTPVVRGYVANPRYLRDAVKAGDVETVKAILRRRPRLVGEIWAGEPPLHTAATYGRLEIMKVLLAHNANVNFATPHGSRTALMAACIRGDHRVAKLLIEAGAQVHALDSRGESALDFARDYGDAKLAEVLIQHGARCGRRE